MAPPRHTLHAPHAPLHARPELHALPRTRLCSGWQIGEQWEAPARPAHFLLRDHRESVWVVEHCDVVAGADRIGPLATIVASTNAPHPFFESEVPELRADRFVAWRELPVTGTLRGCPVFGGRMLVFTRRGRLPWVPVTAAEYLDFTKRDRQRRLDGAHADEAAARAAAAPTAPDELLERAAQGICRTDPAIAERLSAEMRAQHAQARAGEAAAQARRRSRPGVAEAPAGARSAAVTLRAGQHANGLAPEPCDSKRVSPVRRRAVNHGGSPASLVPLTYPVHLPYDYLH